MLQHAKTVTINDDQLKAALEATCRKRSSLEVLQRGREILAQIYADDDMQNLWKKYQMKFDYAAGWLWDEVMESVQSLLEKAVR